jgi:hypothetical protein
LHVLLIFGIYISYMLMNFTRYENYFLEKKES